MKNKTLRIVHIVEAFAGGVNTYLRLVLPELVDRGFAVTLVCSLNRGYPAAEKTVTLLRDYGIEIQVVPMTRSIHPIRDIRSFIRLYSILRQGQFDIVHTHCSKAGALGRTAAFLAGVRTILHTPHCFAFLRCRFTLQRWIYLNLERCLGMITTKIIAVSQYEAKIATRRHITSRSKSIVIYNGLYDNAPAYVANDKQKVSYKRLLGISQTALVVTTVCQLIDYKGIFRFLQAAKVSSLPNVVFLVVGDGKLRSAAKEYITTRGLDNKVILLGHMDNIEDIYRITDLIVLCSDVEGQPYSLLEAMRARCAIVATRVPGNADLIIHGRTGYLTETYPDAIAYAIDLLLQDGSRRYCYGDNAYAYFHRHHLLKFQIDKLTKIYQYSINAGRKDIYATAYCQN